MRGSNRHPYLLATTNVSIEEDEACKTNIRFLAEGANSAGSLQARLTAEFSGITCVIGWVLVSSICKSGPASSGVRGERDKDRLGWLHKPHCLSDVTLGLAFAEKADRACGRRTSCCVHGATVNQVRQPSILPFSNDLCVHMMMIAEQSPLLTATPVQLRSRDSIKLQSNQENQGWKFLTQRGHLRNTRAGFLSELRSLVTKGDSSIFKPMCLSYRFAWG